MRASSTSQAARVVWLAPAPGTYNVTFTIAPSSGVCSVGYATVAWGRAPGSATASAVGVTSAVGPVSIPPLAMVPGDGYRVSLLAIDGCDTWILQFSVATLSFTAAPGGTTEAPTTQPPTSAPSTPRPPLVVSQDRFINGEWVCPPVVVFDGGSVIVRDYTHTHTSHTHYSITAHQTHMRTMSAHMYTNTHTSPSHHTMNEHTHTCTNTHQPEHR